MKTTTCSKSDRPAISPPMPTIALQRGTHAKVLELAAKQGVSPCMLASSALNYMFAEFEAGRMQLTPNTAQAARAE